MPKLPRQRRLIVEPLEPRLMFSATADIAVFHDAASDADALNQAAITIDLSHIYALPDAPVAELDTPLVDPIVTTDTPANHDLSTTPASSILREPETAANPATIADAINMQPVANEVPDSPGLTSAIEPTTFTVHNDDGISLVMASADAPALGSSAVTTAGANAAVFVFVDTTVENYQALVKDIQDNSGDQAINIIYLEPEQNGVQQISESLSNQTCVAAIHLITHGNAGSFQLGSAAVNQNTLHLYAAELSSWQSALSADADILIYACDLAQTDAGQQLIAQLGELTHADIAASNDLTGSALRGGDWDLEAHYGSIETSVIVSAETQQSWDLLLSNTNYINISSTNSAQTFKNSANVGQEFLYNNGGTYVVNQICVQLETISGAAAQTITVTLRDTWNGPILRSDTLSSTVLTNSFRWYAFDFADYTLNSGQNYIVQIYSNGSDSKVAVAYNSSNQWNQSEFIVNGVHNSAADMSFVVAYDDGSNVAPYVNNTIATQNATEKVPFNFQFSSTVFKDNDIGDQLTYTATLANGAALPTWLNFDTTPNIRRFTGTPGSDDAGTLNIKVIATDPQGATASTTFNLVVANNNIAPTVATPIADQSASEDSAFNFQFSSSAFNDADVGDTLTYSATLSGGAALPSWLSFNAATRTFSGTPSNSDLGTISVQVTANDNQGGTISDTFDIVTANTNDAPTVANLIPDKTATEDAAFSFQFVANTFADMDVGDTLSYSATLANGSALPAWLSFNAATRTFSGTPTNGDVGTLSVKVIADDGNGGTISDGFDIVIANTNDAPTVANTIPDQNATEDSAFNFQFASNVFNDVDVSDTLAYTATLSGGAALPSWLSFNAVTRTFSGTPGNADVGTISVQVTANDSHGGIISDTFDIVTANTNDAPTVANLIPDKTATEDSAFSFQFAANAFADIDVGDSLSYSATLAGGGALPAWLNFNAATRTFSGTPANGDVGTISVKVVADDGNGSSIFDTFDIVVANTNDAPTLANTIADQIATQDSPFSFQFAANSFADVDAGDTLTYSATVAGGALPAWLSFDANTRTFSGTPLSNHVGTVSVQVTANDGHGGTSNDTFDIVIANINDAPTLANVIPDRSVVKLNPFNYQIAANAFADIDGDTLTYSAQLAGGGALPAWLSFDVNTRTFSGTPQPGDVGSIAVEVTVNDGSLGVSDTFNITVTNTNFAPTVANTIADKSVNEDAAFNFQFAANTFSDADGDTLAYTAQLSGGAALPSWLSFNAATRTFSGTPTNADVGTLSVEVIADDGNVTASDIFAIVIDNTNDAPVVANAIADQNASEDSAFSFQFPANTFNDVDVGATLNYTATLAGGGALPAWLSFNGATRTFSGTPINGDVGILSVTVIADDGLGGTGNDTFDIVIANTNDAPTLANAIADQTASEDSAFSFQVPVNSFNDVDSSDTLSYSATLSGGGALPSWLNFNAVTRTFSGTPLNANVGSISVEVTVDDGNGSTLADTFTIVINNSNDAPTVANIIADQNATEDTAFNFQFPANSFSDMDLGDTLTYSATLSGGAALPSWLSFNAATRTFSGTPLNGDVGTLAIEVTASDGQGGSVADTFDLVIANSNDAPTLANTIADQTATEDSAFSFQFAANIFNDIDPGNNLSYSASLAGGAALPSWLSFNAATRTFSGTPLNSDVSTLAIEVTANDSQGGTVADTFDLVIANTNDAPTLTNAIPNQTATEDSAFSFQFAATIFNDIDIGDTLHYSASLAGGTPLPLWLSFNSATRTFSGTPLNVDVGSITLEVTATDSQGGSIVDSFDLVIANTNDAPSLANTIANQTALEDAAFTFQFAANTFSDLDSGDTLNYTAKLSGGAALPSWLSFDANTRTFSGTPHNNDLGNLSIRVTANDNNGGIISETFTILVNNSNDIPSLSNPLPDQSATQDAAFNFQFASDTFSDIDLGDSLTYTAQTAAGALPTWLSFDNNTRTFSGTPGNADVGTLTVQVTASDGQGGTLSDSFDIVIANINDSPYVSQAIATQIATEDAAFNFVIADNTFADADAVSALTYSAALTSGAALPAWLNFAANTRTFSGTPQNGDVGSLAITVTADDGNGGSIAASFDIVIANTNDAPTLVQAIAKQTATEDAAFYYQIPNTQFADPDIDAILTYSASLPGGGALPAWLSFDPVTRTFSGTPTNNDVGSFSVQVNVDDGQGQSTSETFTLVTLNGNDAPTLAHTVPTQTAKENSAFSFQFAANTFADIDAGSTLSYSAQLANGQPLPAWLSFNAASRTFSGTPLNYGTLVVLVTADDGNGGSLSSAFSLIVEKQASTYHPEPLITTIETSVLPGVETPPTVPPLVEVDTHQTAPAQTHDAVDAEPTTILITDSQTPPILITINNSAPEDNKNTPHLLDIRNSLSSLSSAPFAASLITPDAGFSSSDIVDFNSALHRVRDEMNQAMDAEEMQKSIISGITFSVTSGLIIWSLRASSLLLSLMSMVPLWSGMDPLPILEQVNKRKQELKQQRKDKQKEDENAKEVGYLFDRADPSPPKGNLLND